MVLCIDAKKLDFCEVVNALCEASSLEGLSNEGVSPDKILRDFEVPELGWLEVFYSLKIPYAKFISGGSLTKMGREKLIELSNNPDCCPTDVCSAYFENVARSRDALKAWEMLSVEDLAKIKKYSEVN